MQPHELIAELVRRTGKSTLQVAREMQKASFQGTLHRYINGNASNPTRQTAKAIADYFNLPVDALYDKALALRIAKERGLAPDTRLPPVVLAQEPAPVRKYHEAEEALPAVLMARIKRLKAEHRKGLISMMETYLDAVDPMHAHAGKARRA